MIRAIEFLRTVAILNNWFVRGVLTVIVSLIAAEIIGIIRNQKVRQENFYVFRRAAKLRSDDYDTLLGQKHPPPYLLREPEGSAFENRVMEKMELGVKVMLTGKAGIGKTHMVIWCAKRFGRHFLALPKPEKLDSLKLPKKLFFFRSKVILFFDDLQYFSIAGTRLPYLFSSLAKQSRDLRVIATCRTEELGKITEEDRKLFTAIQIPHWTDEEGEKLASMIRRQEAYRRYFDGTPASIVMNLYKRRDYYIKLVNQKSSSRLILLSLKLLFVAGIHRKLKPANGNLVREISERIFEYRGSWELDVEELERHEFISRLDKGIQCLDKYLLEVVRDPPKWSPREIQTYLEEIYEIVEKGYTEELLVFGTRLGRMGFLEKGIDAITAYLTRNPDDYVALTNRGTAYGEKGEHDRAIADYTQAIKVDPNYALAYYNRGTVYGKKGEHDRAIADYTQAIKVDPNYAGAYINRGTAYGEKGEYDLAIADCTQAIKIDPKDSAAYINRGNAYYKKGEYDRAIADCTQAIKIDPDYALAYYGRGKTYEEKGDYDRAIADYTLAIKVDPNYAAAYTDRGAVYYKKGDYDRAIADYTQAIKVDPNYALAYYNRGNTYYKKGEYDRAIADYTQAIKVDPNYAAAYTNRGVAYDEKGGYDRAIADYTQAIKIDPKDSGAYTNRGAVYYKKGDYDLAIADCTQAVKIDPDCALAHINRGNVYYEKGDYDLAITDYTQAIKIDANYAGAYINRGNVYYEKGDYDLAITDYTQAIKIDADCAVEIANKGLDNLTMGFFDAATFYLKEVLGYDGEISDSPEFRRHFTAQLNFLVTRILLKQRQ